jgi:prepilin-type N-terminal cleavage/methylation domain-containing protein
MNHQTFRRTGASAFTLIELLTVIAIIAILMALLFPAIGSVRENAKKVQAKTDLQQIVTAVKAYNTEYGKYPVLTANPSSSTTGQNDPDADTFVGDGKIIQGVQIQYDNNSLFNTLRDLTGDPNGPNHLTNPRHVVYFEGKAVSNPQAPKSGFLDNVTGTSGGGANAAKQGCYYDPWGFEYAVVMDTNYDNQINVSKVYSDFSPHPANSPNTGVGAFSVGKDGQVGSPAQGLKGMYKQGTKTSDDIISWD